MPTKKIIVPDLGAVHIYKRRGSKNMRLSVSHTGAIRVSLPPWVPYRLGLEFAIKKRSWLMEKRKVPVLLKHGQKIGKAHHLVFSSNASQTRISSRLNSLGEIKITLPTGLQLEEESVQQAAIRAILRALKQEAETLLPRRLNTLAAQYGFSYKNVTIKRLSSRWGSCSEDKRITLSCYLIQLPWELIDYVLLHELTHTRIMAHGPVFWKELDKYVDNLPQIRKTMRQHQPAFIAASR